MHAMQMLARWLDRCRDSIWTHDIERDWRKWSRAERILASLLIIAFVLMPIGLYSF